MKSGAFSNGVNYEIEQNAGDSGCFTNLMNGVKSLYGKNPKNVVGDQAFGTEENYNYSEREGIKSYLKFNTFHYESTKKFKENIFLKEHFKYEAEKDKYICPAGKQMRLIEEKERKSKNGYISKIKVYESAYDCTKCKLKAKCTESKRRTIHINEELEGYKARARELLNSEAGIQLRKERGVDVETPYGNIKQNYRFRRFMLRGKNKVTIEMGLLSIGHNLRKIAAKIIEETEKNMLTDENLQTLVA